MVVESSVACLDQQLSSYLESYVGCASIWHTTGKIASVLAYLASWTCTHLMLMRKSSSNALKPNSSANTEIAA